MDYGICQLCGEDRLLLRASHLVPSSLYRHMKPGTAQFGLITTATGVSRKGQSPGGQSLSGHTWMDTCSTVEPVATDLFCGRCDNDRFGAWDFYAHHILAERLSGARLDGARRLIEPIHYGRLKLFLWSVFWRAALAPDERFPALAKLPLAELRSRLRTADPAEPDYLPVSIFVNDGPAAAWSTLPLTDNVALIAGRYAFVWGGPASLHRDRLEVTIV